MNKSLDQELEQAFTELRRKLYALYDLQVEHRPLATDLVETWEVVETIIKEEVK